MKLSRLEVYGFKSFAKKLDLKLLGGMTALVGPNGCGKSNVIDAIRWVLGEQKPSQIRLDRMEDVLFKGSGSRSQLGMSEVSLTVENTSGILQVDLPEITVTRRLFRSGESEYMINRKVCRLADINDMFMDTGMGSESYSVFEQGMINAILSDKAEDRRHIFEEAAGITKYKSRRRSAINTLNSIEGDLNRLGDIVFELERRVGFLKRQASKAARYRRLKSELKSKTIALGSYEIEIHKEKIVSVESELSSVLSALEISKVKSSNFASECENISAEIVTTEKKLAEIAGQYEANVRAIAEKENETVRLESRLESLEEMAVRARETAKRNSEALEKLAQTHSECAKELTGVEKRLQVNDSNYSSKVERFRTLETAVTEKTERQKILERDFRAIENEIMSGKSALENIRLRREDGEKRLLEISVRREELTVTLEEITKKHEEYRQRKSQSGEIKNELSVKLADLKAKLSELNKESRLCDEELLLARNKQVSIKAEVDFLGELIRSLRGYSEGVKNAVKSDVLKDRVHGVLADVVSTDDTYLKAVETALFSYLQNIVVDSPEAARDGVAYLTEGTRGRAVFVPLNEDADTVSETLPSGDGVVGYALDFVRTDKRFGAVVARYLKNTVIVDSLETAMELHERYAQFNFAALSGEMVTSNGDIHGGAGKDDTGKSSIGRNEKFNASKAELAEAEKQVEFLAEKKKKLTSDYNFMRGSIETCEKQFEKAGVEFAEIVSKEAGVKGKKETTLGILNNLNEESAKITVTLEDFDGKDKELKERVDASMEKFAEQESMRTEISDEINELNTEHGRLRTEINTYEIERAAMKEKKAALEHEIEEMNNRRESLASTSKYTIKDINDAEAESLLIGEKKKNITEDLGSLNSDHSRLESRKIELGKQYSGLRTFRNEKEKELQELRESKVELSRKESSLTLDKDEAKMIMYNIIERITEEYFISPEEIQSAEIEDDPDFEPAQEKLILADIRKKIHSIGDVNLTAENDYNEEKKRLDYLEEERNDLVEGRDALMETITKINDIAKARFVDTFELIKVNFQKTFHDFFDGGVCGLDIAEGEDPLEANIQIIARPPGKNVRSINILSSGERALTAISLLFAIYMVKPSPYCILDEVDAPLDDANLNRFLRVIKEFSKKIQFIMVTHNKKTMAQANNLYGITMAEPGLSSLVSVRLSEVDSYSEKNTTPNTAESGGKPLNA
jgi:chromosome segregation protein